MHGVEGLGAFGVCGIRRKDFRLQGMLALNSAFGVSLRGCFFLGNVLTLEALGMPGCGIRP